MSLHTRRQPKRTLEMAAKKLIQLRAVNRNVLYEICINRMVVLAELVYNVAGYLVGRDTDYVRACVTVFQVSIWKLWTFLFERRKPSSPVSIGFTDFLELSRYVELQELSTSIICKASFSSEYANANAIPLANFSMFLVNFSSALIILQY